MTEKDEDRIFLKNALWGFIFGGFFGAYGIGAGWDFIKLKQREDALYEKAYKYIKKNCTVVNSSAKALSMKFQTANSTHEITCLDVDSKDSCSIKSTENKKP